MKRTHLLVLPSLVVLAATVAAQTPQIKKPETVQPVAVNTKSAKDLEAERVLSERKAQAQSLLISLANDAGTFIDQSLRARTQARIADIIWDLDPARARTLFRKAWDAAEIADAEGQQRVQDDIRDQRAKSGDGGYVVASPPEVRKEVLNLAVKHELSLGDEFLVKLKEKEQENGGDRNASQAKDEAAAQRLGVARQLLAAGETERALQFANPVLNSISVQTIDFLSFLREKNAQLADERYASILSLAAASPQLDPNPASLLASYIFTPHFYVTYNGAGGASTHRSAATTGPAEVAPALRTAFFRVAAEILMRPIQTGQDQTKVSAINKYYVIKRLLPFFEQFAAPELTAAVRGQMDALSSLVSDNQRPGQEETVRDGLPKKPGEDREQSLLDRVDRAKTSAERDQMYLQLALNRAGAGDLKARDYADKIDESELRQSVRAYVDASLAMRFIEKKDIEAALEIVRSGELTSLQKVWTMSRAARMLMVGKQPDRERALQILDDAATEARRIGGSDPDRPRAFLAVANAQLAIDSARGWDSMADVVKAANSAPDFTGEDGQLTFRIISKSTRSINQHATGEFDVAGIFQVLANQDYDRAVGLARVFEREAPRSHAVIAIALAILSEKKK